MRIEDDLNKDLFNTIIDQTSLLTSKRRRLDIVIKEAEAIGSDDCISQRISKGH